MNITIKILVTSEDRLETIKELILFYSDLKCDLQKTHSDITMNIEVSEN